MKLIKSALLSVSILAAASAQAVTVFAPTSGDVDYVYAVGSTAQGDLFYFDATTANLAAAYSETLSYTDGESWAVSTEKAINTNFFVALLLGGDLIYDQGYVQAGALDAGSVIFANGTSLLVDLEVQEVPVPAAAWLFGSAMLGLAGVKRRK